MIRVYILPLLNISGVEQVAGVELIHDALLEGMVSPDFMKLIMDTSDAEHYGFVAVAASWHVATQEEIDLFNDQVTPFVPCPICERIQEILHQSPPPIPAPEQWELFRLLAKLHGIHV